MSAIGAKAEAARLLEAFDPKATLVILCHPVVDLAGHLSGLPMSEITEAQPFAASDGCPRPQALLVTAASV
jgi:hypothetical protein